MLACAEVNAHAVFCVMRSPVNSLSGMAISICQLVPSLWTATYDFGFQDLSPQQLSLVIDPARNRTVRYNILHGLHDEAGHQGEMWLLRKLQNANAR